MFLRSVVLIVLNSDEEALVAVRHSWEPMRVSFMGLGALGSAGDMFLLASVHQRKCK